MQQSCPIVLQCKTIQDQSLSYVLFLPGQLRRNVGRENSMRNLWVCAWQKERKFDSHVKGGGEMKRERETVLTRGNSIYNKQGQWHLAYWRGSPWQHQAIWLHPDVNKSSRITLTQYIDTCILHNATLSWYIVDSSISFNHSCPSDNSPLGYPLS